MIKPLKTSFRHDKYDFVMVSRQNNVAVFRKTKDSHSSYEVIIVRQKSNPSSKLGIREHYEAYPVSEEWGIYGWSCTTLERANEKMQELLDDRFSQKVASL